MNSAFHEIRLHEVTLTIADLKAPREATMTRFILATDYNHREINRRFQFYIEERMEKNLASTIRMYYILKAKFNLKSDHSWQNNIKNGSMDTSTSNVTA